MFADWTNFYAFKIANNVSGLRQFGHSELCPPVKVQKLNRITKA